MPLLLGACEGAGSNGSANGVIPTVVPGGLSISPFASESISVGESTSATVMLTGSQNVTTPVNVAISSNNPSVAIISPTTCSLTTSSNSCSLTLTGESAGSLTFSASVSGYTTITSESLTVIAIHPTITAFSLKSATNGPETSGTITGESISVIMPGGTDLESLIATFATNPTGARVSINSTNQISGTTVNNFEGSVIYTVTSNGVTTSYTVAVTNPLFICVADNAVTPSESCGCLIQNDGRESPLMWYGESSNLVTNSGYGWKFTQESAVLESFNADAGHCGYTDWRIPSLSTEDNDNYYFGEAGNKINESTDFGSLGNYAISNGYQYMSNLIVWLNSNGFNLKSACEADCFYWSSTYFEANAWVVGVNGLVIPDNQPTLNLLFPVRGGQ